MNKSHTKSFLLFTLILSVSLYSLFDSEESIGKLHKHFRNCEYQQTIRFAELLLKNSNMDKKEKSQIYIIKGISEFSSNQILNAKITFAELILFDNNVTLDPREVSPKIITFFNELKNKLETSSI